MNKDEKEKLIAAAETIEKVKSFCFILLCIVTLFGLACLSCKVFYDRGRIAGFYQAIDYYKCIARGGYSTDCYNDEVKKYD